MSDDHHELSVRLIHETEFAFKVNDGTKDAWVPKSKCELSEQRTDGTYTLRAPEWLLKEKELI
jgi:hypothetical protein